ncbi:MAG TPA: ACP S-malonyltransferase, partial [Gammaproteobacteria bacterium]|nr:ACP S-malonyltransferase [Gammaproteobacteria bacterium]
QQFRRVLETTEFREPAIRVLSNYTGKLHEPEPEAIRSRLFFQLFNPVRWFGCMNTAIDAGMDCIVEFGGGIGKGTSPDEKRPNLEGIVKKSLKWREHDAQYLPAINAAGIRSAVRQLVADQG